MRHGSTPSSLHLGPSSSQTLNAEATQRPTPRATLTKFTQLPIPHQATTTENRVKLWCVDGGSCVLLRGHKGRVLCVAFSPMGEMVCSGAADSTLRLWHTDGGECIATLSGHTDRVRSSPRLIQNILLTLAECISTPHAGKLWYTKLQSEF